MLGSSPPARDHLLARRVSLTLNQSLNCTAAPVCVRPPGVTWRHCATLRVELKRRIPRQPPQHLWRRTRPKGATETHAVIEPHPWTWPRVLARRAALLSPPR